MSLNKIKFAQTDFTEGTDYLAPDGNGSALTDLNASEITSGTLDSGVLDTDVTVQGNTFNGASQLVQLNSSGQYPALDGSLITNIDAGGGVVDFEDKGTVTTDITLTENVITTAYFSGSNSITLPTVTDTTKQVVCILDFTTASTGQPTITNSVALTGTIAVTNASASVTGTSTAFTTELNVGDTIIISSVEYYVSTIASDTSLTLSTTYDGTTASGLTGHRKILKWSSVNSGKVPSAWSILSGVRNQLVFKNYWENSLCYWEVEYKTYGAVELSFSQPTLTANGTLGGDRFAVSGKSNAYLAFDGNSSTYVSFIATSEPLIMYNPDALKLTLFYIYFHSARTCYGFTLYGSDDGLTYTFLQSYSGTWSGATYGFTVSDSVQDFYKYYKLVWGSTSDGYVTLYEATLTATYLAT